MTAVRDPHRPHSAARRSYSSRRAQQYRHPHCCLLTDPTTAQALIMRIISIYLRGYYTNVAVECCGLSESVTVQSSTALEDR